VQPLERLHLYDIPKKSLAVVDALVAKDRLSSQLLPVIAELRNGGGYVKAMQSLCN
jgi:hypothetical protein